MVISFALFGCSKKADISEIDNINGYWQISKAVNADGDKKEYPINEIYDYFEVKNKIGFHKKVRWQPDGTFLINDLSETIKIIDTKKEIKIDFFSKFGKHSEVIEFLSENELILKMTDDSKMYFNKVVLNTEK